MNQNFKKILDLKKQFQQNHSNEILEQMRIIHGKTILESLQEKNQLISKKDCDDNDYYVTSCNMSLLKWMNVT